MTIEMIPFHEHYIKAYLIRIVEEKLLQLFIQGKLFGTTHTCIGQEMSAVSITTHLREGDVVFSNHRCHGHYIARTDDVEGLIAEIMGKSTGVCGGLGGSQHLCHDNFFSNGVQGGIAPVSNGIALGQKQEKSQSVTVVCLGDGTLGEGVVYESMNIASKWKLPLLFVLENNKYAQSTSQEETLAGSILDRAGAFDIDTYHGNIWDYEELDGLMEKAVNQVRSLSKPGFVQIDNYRLGAHSKGDDDRSPEEIQPYRDKDPLTLFIKEHASETTLQEIIVKIHERVDHAVLKAEEAGFGELEVVPQTGFHPVEYRQAELEFLSQVQAINQALDEQLNQNPKILVLGEDIRSPYGGAFKVTKSLSDKYPNQIFNTPISEACIVGIGNGLSLKGFRPIVEIMFGDFVTLAFDQIVNHASKFRGMYHQKVSVPLLIRTPMGGGRGYGPTHSQCLEKHLLGIPDVHVFVLHGRTRVKSFYSYLIENIKSPSIVIENKLLYPYSGDQDFPKLFNLWETDEEAPTTILKPTEAPDLTIVAIGRMSLLAEKVAEYLYDEEELVTELIFPLQISPLNIFPILDSVSQTHKLVVLEEGVSSFDIGSEIIADLTCRWREEKVFIAQRVGALGIPIPNSRPLEDEYLPSFDQVLEICLEVNDV